MNSNTTFMLNPDAQLLRAAMNGHMPSVEKALRKGADFAGACDEGGRTPLHLAILHRRLDVAFRLLEIPCIYVDAKDTMGDTPFLLACSRRANLELVKRLVECGADPHHCNRQGLSAVAYACSNHQNLRVVEYLLVDCGCDPKLADDNERKTGQHSIGRGARDLAYSIGSTEICNLVLAAYRDKVVGQEDNCFPVHTILRETKYKPSARRGICVKTTLGALRLEHFVALLRLFDPSILRIRDSQGRLPLHIAAAGGAPVGVLEALMFPLACRVEDNFGACPIHVACTASAPLDVIQYLVERDGVAVTIRKRDNRGRLPLHLLLRKRRLVSAPKLETVQYLTNAYPQSLAARVPTGCLPIMLAARASASLDVIHYLLRQDPQVVTRFANNEHDKCP